MAKIDIKEAHSFTNGIFFRSNKIPELGVFAYEKGGKIEAQVCPVVSLPKYAKPVSYIRHPVKELVLGGMIAIIALILNIVTQHNFFCLIWFSICLSLEELIEIWKTRKETAAKKIHAAEHMAINAYNKNKQLPDISAVQAASMYTKNCSTYMDCKKIVKGVILGVLIMFAPTTSSLLRVVVEVALLIIIDLVIIFILDKLNFIKYLEFAYLKKPTDREIKIALAGLKAFIELEEQFPEISGHTIVFNFFY